MKTLNNFLAGCLLIGLCSTAVAGKRYEEKVRMKDVCALVKFVDEHPKPSLDLVRQAGFTPRELGRYRVTYYDRHYQWGPVTASGLRPQCRVCAVDPTVIPLLSVLWVESYGLLIAGDTGGLIKGAHLDVWRMRPKDGYPTSAKVWLVANRGEVLGGLKILRRLQETVTNK